MVPRLMARADLTENFLVALDTLRARKGRSALTILGIVIGITSVISVASIITGLNRNVMGRIQALGARVFIISRFPPGTNPFRMPEYVRMRKHFRFEDAAAIQEGCRSCQKATSFGTRATFFGQSNEIHYGRERTERFILRGTDAAYAEVIPLFSVSEGRFISDFDMEHATYVCVLGAAIAQSLFPVGDPLGQEVTLNGQRFEVIGVFEKDTALFGGSVDQFVVIPYSTFHKLYPEAEEHILAVSVADPALIPQAVDQTVEVLRRVRRVPPEKENDFEISTPEFFTQLWNQLTGALVLLTTAVSSIGLLVGGIGVMNIMLISVTERTQEIGVRKAVGARRRDIRAQFLIEAVMLTSLGGVIGILLGAVITFLVHRLLPSLPAEMSLFWVALSFTLSAAIGLFFGYYPAHRAAELDPVVCLRYE
jgi:putative ABC transport system permease protein